MKNKFLYQVFEFHEGYVIALEDTDIAKKGEKISNETLNNFLLYGKKSKDPRFIQLHDPITIDGVKCEVGERIWFDPIDVVGSGGIDEQGVYTFSCVGDSKTPFIFKRKFFMNANKKRIIKLERYQDCVDLRISNLVERVTILCEINEQNKREAHDELYTLVKRIQSLEAFLGVESYRIESPAKVEQGHRKILKKK